MGKKGRKKGGMRHGEKAEWKFLDDLHKASIQLDGAEAHAARSLIAWHADHGYLTPRQKTYAANLTAKVFRKDAKVLRGPKMHYLYAVTDGVNVKLGFSVNPKARLKGLQTGHPAKLQLIWTLACGDSPAQAGKAERKLHRYCKDYAKHGEWFDIKCMIVVRQFEIKRQLDSERKERDVELAIVAEAVERI